MSEPASVIPAASWVSAHAFHAGALDALIIDGVAPVVGALSSAGLIDGYFFLRYWEGGPHLRLRLRPTGARPEWAAEIRRLVTEKLGGYLAAHPSTRRMTARRYAALAGRFAVAEDLPRYERALRPNDSVAFIAYRPELHWYGRQASLAAVERHFVESSELALGLLIGGTPPARRGAVALALLTLTLAVGEPDPGRVARWFTPRRAVSNLAPDGPSPSELAGFEAGYRQHRRGLLTQTARLWETAGGSIGADRQGVPGGDTLRGWLRSVRALHARLRQLCAQGHFPPPGFRFDPPPADQIPTDQTSPGDPDAITLVLSRCAHLLCNRLGLSLTGEVYLRFLLARALTDLTASPLGIDDLAVMKGQSSS
ncbi:MAG TPA: lantibiotic dehydratase C-terminal domain-containing protein [Pseudonocardiaceae bacterium]|nr:lantibiotic dehydratase C-terminal domain-containing protein [Pseudonocardiaceae bacterium]